jgi:acyl-coenzyme A thioesterase PaaI-like protein
MAPAIHRKPNMPDALPDLDPGHFPPLLMHAIGFEAVLRTDPAGIAVVRYVPRPEHAHSEGRVVQGGFVTSWLDHSMAVAVRTREPGAALASLDINVSFLERVEPGHPVFVEARVVRWGGRVAFLQAELRGGEDANTAVLARATSTGMIRRKSAPAEVRDAPSGPSR